jgi:hypothetical protein
MAMPADGVSVKAVIRGSDDQIAVPINVDLLDVAPPPGKIHSALTLHFVASRTERDLARCRCGSRSDGGCGCRSWRGSGTRRRLWCRCRRCYTTYCLSIVEGVLLGTAANGLRAHLPMHADVG